MSSREEETHYLLTRPDVVVRVEDGLRTLLAPGLPTIWSRPGAGRRAAAAVILADALGSAPHPALVHGFTGDVLDYYGTVSELVISLEEVLAWCRDRGSELAMAGTPSFASLPQALAHRDHELSVGPRPGWLAMYRTIHGEPDLAERG